MPKTLLIILSILLLSAKSKDKTDYFAYKVKSGENLAIIFKKFDLEFSTNNQKKFRELNNNKDINSIQPDTKYFLPLAKISKEDFDKFSETIDEQLAKEIKTYNNKLNSKKFTKKLELDNLVLVPLQYYSKLSKLATIYNINSSKRKKKIEKTEKEEQIATKKEADKDEDSEKAEDTNSKKHKGLKKNKTYTKTIDLLGKENKTINIVDEALIGWTFYLDAGHGGPDPGAVGHHNGYELSEDEYAYDVTIRFAKKLLEHSANVYMIVQDKENGIRETRYLNNSSSELYIGGEAIDINQKVRLRKRAELVNSLYKYNEFNNKNHHLFVIHVDSRIVDQRIDIFFYHKQGNEKAEKFASTLLTTIEEKYNMKQPGRGYKGSVSSRSLYMLNNSTPTGTYIELGNIQNPKDQVRLLEPNNRQAIANWLCEGTIKAVGKKSAIKKTKKKKKKGK